ncbi:hypothetical protein MRX96_049011 [Rhipicephalus microplus]
MGTSQPKGSAIISLAVSSKASLLPRSCLYFALGRFDNDGGALSRRKCRRHRGNWPEAETTPQRCDRKVSVYGSQRHRTEYAVLEAPAARLPRTRE